MTSAPSFAASSLLVAAGGAVGAWLRFATAAAWSRLAAPSALPVATLTVNLVGSLAMGLLAGWLVPHGAGQGWRLLLGVGVLGGFTTFSAFSLELALLVERGAVMLAASYALLSVVGGIAALFAGLALMRAAA